MKGWKQSNSFSGSILTLIFLWLWAFLKSNLPLPDEELKSDAIFLEQKFSLHFGNLNGFGLAF